MIHIFPKMVVNDGMFFTFRDSALWQPESAKAIEKMDFYQYFFSCIENMIQIFPKLKSFGLPSVKFQESGTESFTS